MTKMTYAEAVKQMEDLSAIYGDLRGDDSEAIAVLRRAEPVIGEIEGAAIFMNGEILCLAYSSEQDILRKCLTYKKGEPK